MMYLQQCLSTMPGGIHLSYPLDPVSERFAPRDLAYRHPAPTSPTRRSDHGFTSFLRLGRVCSALAMHSNNSPSSAL